MDKKGMLTLRHVFWDAFAGNQSDKYARLKRHGLEIPGGAYADVWEALVTRYGEERLASVIKKEIEGRLLPDHLNELRALYWDDQLPSWDLLQECDPHGHPSWVKTKVRAEGNKWITDVLKWSPFADFYFQYVEHKTRPHA